MASIAAAVSRFVGACSKSNQRRTTSLTAASSLAEVVGDGEAVGVDVLVSDGRATGLLPVSEQAASNAARASSGAARRNPRTNTAKG